MWKALENAPANIRTKNYISKGVLSPQEEEARSLKACLERWEKEFQEVKTEYATLETKYGKLSERHQQLLEKEKISPLRLLMNGALPVIAVFVTYNIGWLDRPLEWLLTQRKPVPTIEQTVNRPGNIASGIKLEGIINTSEELYEFLEIPPSDSPREEKFKAYLQAFQEKCNYALGMEVPITGEPNVETYLAATVIRQSPELQEKIRIREYAYFNRPIDGYEVKIPHLAVVKVKERLGNVRSIENALGATNPTIIHIARELTKKIITSQQKAERLLRFVQSIPYNYDVDIDDFPKHRLETLADGGGDCEDGAILYASLAKAAGLDSAVVAFDKPRHTMVLVAGIQYGWGLDVRGKKYTLAETRGKFLLGDIPKEYHTAKVYEIIIVPYRALNPFAWPF